MKKLIFLFLAFVNTTVAQTVNIKFNADSMEVGKPIKLMLSCKHDNLKELILPDSSFKFGDFNLENIELFPTKTLNGLSIDSAVYTLVSFKTDSMLNLKVWVSDFISKSKFNSNTDTVYFKSNLKLDDLKNRKLKPQITYYAVPLDVNYPRILYFLGIISFIGIVVWLFLGQIFIKQFQLFMYQRKHQEFMSQFKKLIKNRNKKGVNQEALVLWKNHLEWLTNAPISTMTSQEVALEFNNQSLGEVLSNFDAVIFGGLENPLLHMAYEKLINTAQEKYLLRKEKLKQQLKNKK